MFIKKKATSGAFQALITQRNFAAGSSEIKNIFLMLIEFAEYNFFKKSVKNKGSVRTNIVKNSYLSFFFFLKQALGKKKIPAEVL